MLSFLRKNDQLASAVERELRLEAQAGRLSPRQHRLAVEMADNMDANGRVLRQMTTIATCTGLTWLFMRRWRKPRAGLRLTLASIVVTVPFAIAGSRFPDWNWWQDFRKQMVDEERKPLLVVVSTCQRRAQESLVKQRTQELQPRALYIKGVPPLSAELRKQQDQQNSRIEPVPVKRSASDLDDPVHAAFARKSGHAESEMRLLFFGEDEQSMPAAWEALYRAEREWQIQQGLDKARRLDGKRLPFDPHHTMMGSPLRRA